MKKKIIIASATVLFAVATVFNMTLLQGNSVGDVSLESIEIMVNAHGELTNAANIGYYYIRCTNGTYILRCGGGTAYCQAAWQGFCD